MTIQDVYKKARDFLNQDFITNPALEAKILISHILKIDEKEFILIKDTKEITNSDFEKLFKLIDKRLKGKSIAAIINKKNFYDLEFYVDDTVLIPRPETEQIIDIILEKFNKNENLNIIDIGCGSGNISITLAKHLGNSKIDTLDISEKALEITRTNVKKNNLHSERINFIHEDFLEYSTEKKYDIIVSNPPYIKSDEINDLYVKKMVSDPKIALDGGQDGLDFYHKLNKFAINNLKVNGWLIMEHGLNQRDDILRILNKVRYKIETYNDLAGIDRIIAACFKG